MSKSILLRPQPSVTFLFFRKSTPWNEKLSRLSHVQLASCSVETEKASCNEQYRDPPRNWHILLMFVLICICETRSCYHDLRLPPHHILSFATSQLPSSLCDLKHVALDGDSVWQNWTIALPFILKLPAFRHIPSWHVPSIAHMTRCIIRNGNYWYRVLHHVAVCRCLRKPIRPH